MPKAAQLKDFGEYETPDRFLQTLPSTPLSIAQEKELSLAIMNLFVAVAIADQKFLPVEAKTCLHAFKSCFRDKIDLSFVTEYDFEANAEKIKNILNGPGKKYWLGTQYMRLRAYPDYQILLDRLWKISVCDGKLDSREAEIIDFFAYFWKRQKQVSPTKT